MKARVKSYNLYISKNAQKAKDYTAYYAGAAFAGICLICAILNELGLVR